MELNDCEIKQKIINKFKNKTQNKKHKMKNLKQIKCKEN